MDDFGESVVFPQEPQQFGGGSVNGEEPGVGHLLVREHRFEEDAAAAEPLSRLVDVKVQHAHGINLKKQNADIKVFSFLVISVLSVCNNQKQWNVKVAVAISCKKNTLVIIRHFAKDT